jgi:transposase-like protein
MGKGYSPEQIVRKLREAEGKLSGGAKIPEVARELGVSEATFHRWRKRYGGTSPQEAKRLRNWRRRTPASRSCSPKKSWR